MTSGKQVRKSNLLWGAQSNNEHQWNILQGTNISQIFPNQFTFEDEFTFPQVGYVSFVEGIVSTNFNKLKQKAHCSQVWQFGSCVALPNRSWIPLVHCY